MSDENTLNFFSQADDDGDNPLNLNGSIYSGKNVLTLVNTVTLAELNAGKTILAGVAGKTITPVNFAAKAVGTFITHTTADLEDTNGTPVSIATFGQAVLTDATLLPNDTGVTQGAGFLGALTTGEGIAVTNTGSPAAGGTSITFRVDYLIS